jgi:hypothetical protein
MLILSAVFLFIFIPLVMLLLHLVRPRLNIQGFLAVLTVITGWILVYLARPDIPRLIPLPEWKPVSLFNLSPALLIDDTSWYLALALTSLVVAVVITSITQLGRDNQPGPVSNQKQITLDAESEAIRAQNEAPQPAGSDAAVYPFTGWVLWASILVLTSLGLLSVIAGNLLTLLLAWSALDIIELIILLSQFIGSRTRERVILSFSARMAGICLVLIAGVLLWTSGQPMTFDAITVPVSTFLVLAAGLRLGVLPLHLPFSQSLPIGRNFGTIIRLVPAAASFILLVRVSGQGVTGGLTPYLLGFSVLAGIYAAINWLRAKDETDGRLYWLLATSSLVVASAILRSPAAGLAWSIASLLSGGLIFSMSLRHKNLAFITALGVISLSSLPFTPTWQATALYQNSSSPQVSPALFAGAVLFLLIIQASLLAGFTRHALRGIFPATQRSSGRIERWVWFLYPLGLIFISATHWLIGWMLFPDLNNVPLAEWIMPPLVLVIAGPIVYLQFHSPQWLNLAPSPTFRSAWESFFSLDWLYRFLWRAYRALSRGFAVVSTVLEGEGGLLWALVIFGLIFVFLQR